MNQSCQEVLSQTLDVSTKNNVVNNEITYERSLWSDEVEIMQNINDGNNAGKDAQKGRKENQTGNLIQDATVNPSGFQTRVDDNLRNTINSRDLGGLKYAQLHAEEGTDGVQQPQPIDQSNFNGIVNPSFPSRVNCVSGIDVAHARGVGKVVTDPRKVINDIACSGNQFDSGRSPGTNATTKIAFNEIVNPGLEVVCDLQRKRSEQVVSKGVSGNRTSMGKENVWCNKGNWC
ncbi:hypothetical protein A4A49_04401 [Nicotiana attenuata]|uniref:Uncharacterized protein n=1 Tax=Nicotiana attenuata TaxID=49451 RepID=A0A1J6I036_NICAT|nr:hypothetical protein A4A49_04401 [Nicotiana attenuata]